ncbi:hypothetical protein [Planotetraspora kaengkrachanensis]|uniref:Uncharacterized protein n=1 Tax=Planotetraspora kaengkrachanensis TaxID=575193 RepID=A0A8J3LYU4_9ACTN|nr:hypothetical protein [Planotetraspora kaengkrachanensis]GIG80414.1 hypothetical protein Pka01_35410 [Planotetraspora kaengkrachanensis]
MIDADAPSASEDAREPETVSDPEVAETERRKDGDTPDDERHESDLAPEEPLLSKAIFREAIGAAFVGSRIDNVNLGEARKNVATRVLHADVLQEMSDTYVRIDRNGSDKASEVENLLRRNRFVVLSGDAGTGRLITAVNAIQATHLHPVQIILDQDALDRSLIAKNGQGHLIDLGEIEDGAVSKLSKVLRDYVARIRAASSCLVVIATPRECRLLDPDDDAVVPMIGPSAQSVLRSHLTCAVSRWYADQFSDHPKVKEALQGVTTREAVRLAILAKKKAIRTDRIPLEVIEEVLAEFSDRASADLRNAFNDSNARKSDYDRALLLAVAALEGARVDAVFSATERLVELLEIEIYPGRGQFGSGVSELLASIDAELIDDTIRFRRSDYAMPVLDYIWKDHVYLRKHLYSWLVALGADIDNDQIGTVLLNLAESHGSPDLIVNAVTNWAGKRSSRVRAVQLLDNAALSTEVGRSIRHSLYVWSIAPSTPEEVQVAVAEVCGGRLGIFFPGIALTRLRHLAGRDSLKVRGTVCAALAELGRHDDLREPVLWEVVDWTRSALDRQTTGALAFATLASIRTDDGFVLIPDSSTNEDFIDLLAQGWRATLRNSDTVAGASDIATAWIESAAQAQASNSVIVEIFAMACKSSYDVGIIVPLVRRWALEFNQPSELPRELIYDALLVKLGELRPGLWSRLSRDVYREM